MSDNIVLKRVFVTPDKAQEMLKKMHPKQRTLRMQAVRSYADDMQSGAWNQSVGFVDNPVVISTKGTLMQGQHRLMAIIESGCSVYMYIQYDAPESNYLYYDNACRRTAGDQLRSNDLAALAKLACATEYGDTMLASAVQGKITTKLFPSRAWVIRYANEHDLGEVIRIGKSMSNYMGVGATSVYSYFAWLLTWLDRADNLVDFVSDFTASPSVSKTVCSVKERIWRTKGARADKMDKITFLCVLLNAYDHYSRGDDVVTFNKHAQTLKRYNNLLLLKRDRIRNRPQEQEEVTV